MRYKPVSFHLPREPEFVVEPEALVKLCKAASLQFIFMELDTARVFYELALTTCDKVRTFANAKNAHTATRSAVRVTNRIRTRLSQAEHREIAERMKGLRNLFERLQSKFSYETRITSGETKTFASSTPAKSSNQAGCL